MNNQNQPYQFNNQSNSQINRPVQTQQIGLQQYQINQQQQSIKSNNQYFLPNQQTSSASQQQQPVINNNSNRNESLQQNQTNQQKGKIKILQTRSIQEIMQYFSSERDQFIDPQFRNYLQKDCNIDELKQEYIPRQYQMLELPEITQELDGYIKVRGDGNCFYNTFIYQYVVLVLQKSPDEFKQWKEKFSQLKFIIQFENSNPFSSEDCKKMKETFFQLIEALHAQDSRIRIQQFYEKYSTNWNYLYQLSIIFIRSIISRCLINMKTFDKEKAEFYDIANQEVQVWELDCNYNELVLDSVNKLLKIPLKLFVFEKDSFRIMNYENGQDGESKIFILFRQGHYVIPKVKQIEKSNSNIVYYQQKFQQYQKQIQQQQEQEKIVNNLIREQADAIDKQQAIQIELQKANQENQQLKSREQGYLQQIRDQQNQLQLEKISKQKVQQDCIEQNQQFQGQINNLRGQIREYQEQISGKVIQNEIQKEQLRELQNQIDQYKAQQPQQQVRIKQISQNESSNQPYKEVKQNIKEYQQIGSQIYNTKQQQIQKNSQMEVENQQECQNQQINFEEIKTIYKSSLDKSIIQIFKYDNYNRFYEINNFHLALFVGYLQVYKNNRLQLIANFKNIRPQMEKFKFLLEKFEELSFNDLNKITSGFSNQFFMYIMKQQIDSDESLEDVTKILDIQLELIKIFDKKIDKKVFNKYGYKKEVKIIYFQSNYYLPNLDQYI